MSLQLPNGSRIVGLPGVENAVRGFSAVSLMLIDEAPASATAFIRRSMAASDGDGLKSTAAAKGGLIYADDSRMLLTKIRMGH